MQEDSAPKEDKIVHHVHQADQQVDDGITIQKNQSVVNISVNVNKGKVIAQEINNYSIEYPT